MSGVSCVLYLLLLHLLLFLSVIGSFRHELDENCVLGLPAFFFDSWPLKMRPTGCSETCVRNYHYSLRKAQRSAVCIYTLFTFYEELDTRVHIPYMLNFLHNINVSCSRRVCSCWFDNCVSHRMWRYEGCSKNSRTLSINLCFIYLGAVRPCPLRSSSLHSKYTAPGVFSSFGRIAEMRFVQYRGAPLAIFLECCQQAESVEHCMFQLRELKEVCWCEIWRVRSL